MGDLWFFIGWKTVTEALYSEKDILQKNVALNLQIYSQ